MVINVSTKDGGWLEAPPPSPKKRPILVCEFLGISIFFDHPHSRAHFLCPNSTTQPISLPSIPHPWFEAYLAYLLWFANVMPTSSSPKKQPWVGVYVAMAQKPNRTPSEHPNPH